MRQVFTCKVCGLKTNRQPNERVALPVGRAGAVAGLFLYAVEEIPRSDYASYDDWLQAVTRFFKRLARLKP